MSHPEISHDHIQNVLAMEEEDRAFSDAQIEQEIQAKGLTAPRVTLADIEGAIYSTHFFTAQHGINGALGSGEAHQAFHDYNTLESTPSPNVHSGLSRLTFCVLTFRNGFTVTGESACVSPENFNAELGRKIARQNAIDKCWPLFGFHLAAMLNGPLFEVPPKPLATAA